MELLIFSFICVSFHRSHLLSWNSNIPCTCALYSPVPYAMGDARYKTWSLYSWNLQLEVLKIFRWHWKELVCVLSHSVGSDSVMFDSVVSDSLRSRDCSLSGSSVNGVFQARILEWLAISYSRGSSWLRIWTRISCFSCIGRQILYHCATWEAPKET